MSVKTAIAATALALAASAASAASLDLEALGLVKGALIAETDQALVEYVADFGALLASGDDGTTFGSLSGFLAPSLDVVLTLFSPPVVQPFFEGDLVAYDVDATHAVGLFYDDDAMAYVLAEASAPVGSVFDFSSSFFLQDVSAEVYKVAPIPLPAAAGLLAAGLAALAGLSANKGRKSL